MRDLHNPASCLKVGITLKFLFFLSPWAYMGYVASGDNNSFFSHKGCVKAKILRILIGWGWSEDNKIIEG